MRDKSAKLKTRVYRRGISYPLLFVILLLVCIGLVMVLSSTYTGLLLKDKDSISLFQQQVIVAVAGVIFMLVASKIDYHAYNSINVVRFALLATVLALGAVFLFHARNGAHRWIEIGSFTIQPSEIAKFTMVIWLSYYLSKYKWWYKSLKSWAIAVAPVGLMAAMILAEPNLSTTLCFIAAATVILFIAGMQKWLIGGVVGLGAGLILLMCTVTGYQSDRIVAWLHPWENMGDKSYQVVQSLFALGDGGLFGVGLGNSKQKIIHLPESDTDYIFSIISEEFGFIGAIVVLILYGAFIYYGIKTAIEANDTYGSYLAAGITGVVAIQVLVNVGVVTNSIPSTGVTLPFISRGATSLGVFMAAMGILLSISAYGRRSKPTQKKEKLKR